MRAGHATCWSVIRDAAAGRDVACAKFARRYERVVRTYLAARWQGGALAELVNDAVQDVFLDCLGPGGALDRADPERGAFRNYLYGIVRNVALRHERAHRKQASQVQGTPDLPDGGPSLEEVFDRAWARSLVRQAARRQREKAGGDERAQRRVDLLHLRFRRDLPIREIASRWRVDAAWLHREYATARREFEAALREVVSFHRPGDTPAALAEECRRLILLVS